MADEETQQDQPVVRARDELKDRMDWNTRRFMEMGYQLELAQHMAFTRVDWHDAERLRKKGCSLNHILRILL